MQAGNLHGKGNITSYNPIGSLYGGRMVFPSRPMLRHWRFCTVSYGSRVIRDCIKRVYVS